MTNITITWLSQNYNEINGHTKNLMKFYKFGEVINIELLNFLARLSV